MAGRRVHVGIRRRAAPLARRELSSEINADAIGVRRIWLREILRDDQVQRTVVVRVDARARADVAAWLAGATADAGTAPALYSPSQDAVAGEDTPHGHNADGAAESVCLRTEVAAEPYQLSAEVRTDWIFFPTGPEAILMSVIDRAGGPGTERGADETVEATTPFRFNLRFAADPYRKHLRVIARSGLLGLTTKVLKLGPERELLSPCVFIPVQTGPLRAFLRELPSAPVV